MARASKAGRKGKQGKRTPTGQLSRAGCTPAFDHGSERTQAMQAKFGVHYCWAMGRAYASGLLGEGVEALNRYQAAKRFVKLYTRFYGGSAYHCPLDHSPRGSGHVSLSIGEDQERDRQWLRAATNTMDVAGTRPYFDALISVLHIDQGPFWLDSLIAGSKDQRDRMLLDAAIRGLDVIAPETRSAKILSAVY